MRHRACSLVLALLATVVPRALPAQSARAYVAPTSETVTIKLEVATGAREGHEVWVQNSSTVSVTVTSVSLTNCQNIRQGCHVHRLTVKIPANSRRRVFRVERDVPNVVSNFRYSWSWSAESSSTAALTALAQLGSQEASDRLAAMKLSDEIRKKDVGFADLELYSADVVALGDRIVALRAEPDSIIVPMDSVYYIRQFRVMALDSLGQSLGRYRAGFRIRMEPGAMRLAPPDSLIPVAAGRSVITLAPVADPSRPRNTPLAPVQITIIVP